VKNQISLLIVGATILVSCILRRVKLRADLIYIVVIMKDNPHFNALYSQVAQQTLTSVAESLKQGRLQASEALAPLDVSDTSGFNRLESFFINSQALALLHAIK